MRGVIDGDVVRSAVRARSPDPSATSVESESHPEVRTAAVAATEVAAGAAEEEAEAAADEARVTTRSAVERAEL